MVKKIYWRTLSGKFFGQSIEQAFQELMGRELVTGIQTALQEEFQNFQIVTEADILTVSDGRSLVVAHAGDTYNFIAGELKLLAAVLNELRDVGKCFFFHTILFKNRDKDNGFMYKCKELCFQILRFALDDT